VSDQSRDDETAGRTLENIATRRHVFEQETLAGLALRLVSILTLGRLFTVNVAIHSDHPVVEKGPYRFVRHPSYSGLLLAFIGLGVSFQSWLSILVLLVPIVLAVVNRVATEERALLSFLGPPYTAYCARTKRFIPWVV